MSGNVIHGFFRHLSTTDITPGGSIAGDAGGHAVVAVDMATCGPAGEDRGVGAEGALEQADGGHCFTHQGGELPGDLGF